MGFLLDLLLDDLEVGNNMLYWPAVVVSILFLFDAQLIFKSLLELDRSGEHIQKCLIKYKMDIWLQAVGFLGNLKI